MLKIKKKSFIFITCVLTCVFCSFINSKQVTPITNTVRTIEINQSKVDYQSIFNEFEEAKLGTCRTLTTFEGTKSFSLEDFSELDNLSESNLADCENMKVTYHFSYDSEENIVTVSAITKNEGNIIEVEEIQGVAFINEKGNIDAVMNIDGEGLLLSEMQDIGIIQNCGWFKNLFKKIVKVVAITAAVVAVASVVIATVGATAPAVVAVGAGVVAGTATTTLTSTCLTVAMVTAGISLAATTIASIDFEGVKYELKEFSKVAKELIKGFYYLAIGDKSGMMLVSPIRIPTVVLAATAMKSGLSVYSPDQLEAYIVAQMAGNGMAPVLDPAHQNGYLAHYHAYGRPKPSSHAFYGIPTKKGCY